MGFWKEDSKNTWQNATNSNQLLILGIQGIFVTRVLAYKQGSDILFTLALNSNAMYL